MSTYMSASELWVILAENEICYLKMKDFIVKLQMYF